ncbi:MAG: 6-phosphogluconolactonase [Chlamydiia bacterium]|nr:6-phosphogluconolactonase [Chlamydiia bacterium]
MSRPLEEILKDIDDRRFIAVPGDEKETVAFAVERWVTEAKRAINQYGIFNCALSGGSTPKKIYQALLKHKKELDFSKVRLYFSDERCVPLNDPESNFHMAWNAGFKELVTRDQIFPVYDTGDPKEDAKRYNEKVDGVVFDLIMLGMGDDGHTASLFPKTHALQAKGEDVVANFLPEKEVWRITFTFEAINNGRHINFYVMGKGKSETIKKIFLGPYDPTTFPSQAVGTPSNKALWILDQEAASLLQ